VVREIVDALHLRGRRPPRRHRQNKQRSRRPRSRRRHRQRKQPSRRQPSRRQHCRRPRSRRPHSRRPHSRRQPSRRPRSRRPRRQPRQPKSAMKMILLSVDQQEQVHGREQCPRNGVLQIASWVIVQLLTATAQNTNNYFINKNRKIYNIIIIIY
jgi:hypothetical protein